MPRLLQTWNTERGKQSTEENKTFKSTENINIHSYLE